MKPGDAEITGIILAGGQSSRMGYDKALALYKGSPMITYSIKLLKPFCKRILISTGNPLHKAFGLETIGDVYKNTGPMGGIFSCLLQSMTQANICLPCDVPEMKPEIIENLLSLYTGNSCVVPLTPKPEPLIAIYPQEVTPLIQQLIKKKIYRMTEIFEKFPVTYADLSGLNLQNPKMYFANVNNPDDLII